MLAARWIDATTCEAEAEPPAGVTYTAFKFVAVPMRGGLPSVTVTVALPTARLLGLAPLTEYSASSALPSMHPALQQLVDARGPRAPCERPHARPVPRPRFCCSDP